MPELGFGYESLAYSLLGLVVICLYLSWKKSNEEDLSHIPAIGHSGRLMSYISAVKFLFSANSMLQEGYDKHRSSVFKIANLSRWMVVVSGPKLVEELRKTADDEMSFIEAANEMVQIPYTLGPGISSDPYHVGVLGTQLTRNMHTVIPAVRAELIAAFGDMIPKSEISEWVEVPAVDVLMNVVSRVSNRIFVGLPLCREPDFIALNVRFSTEVLVGAIVVSMFPKVLRPIAARFLTTLSRSTKQMQKFLAPIIKERQSKMEVFGNDYPNKPNDLLSWLLNEAKGDQTSVNDLSSRILAINFAGIHTTSMTLTHALYHLVAHPECVEPLREEIEAVVRQEGWTKAGIDKMRRVDSFFKESLRYSSLRALSMMRKALKPYTFADGTYIPAGTFIFAASHPTHFDNAHYPDAASFDAFRFAKLHDEEVRDGGITFNIHNHNNNNNNAPNSNSNASGTRYQMVTTTAEYLPWGYGRRACPGRFFAAIELKLLLAQLVMTYDIRIEGDVRPKDILVEANCLPNRSAKLLFRERRM